jgi:membrane-associated phospholipid phosphatase
VPALNQPEPPEKRVAALRRALVAFAALGVAFMVFSAAVAAGDLRTTDRQVSATMAHVWFEPVHRVIQVLAVLGGVELTSLVAAALGVYIWRHGFRAEAWAVLAFPLVVLAEVFYKHLVYQPAPPEGVQHGDGPSLSSLFGQVSGAGSFPSGHMARAVFVYGLLAFVVIRMAEREWARRLAGPVAVLLLIAMAFDRIYLNVHWESDVIGGALLGALGLAGAIIWLDRPRAVILR